MASHAKSRAGFGAFNRMIEGCAIGHQRSTGKNSLAMRAPYAFVHAAREAKIIRVEYEFFHRAPKNNPLNENAITMEVEA